MACFISEAEMGEDREKYWEGVTLGDQEGSRGCYCFERYTLFLLERACIIVIEF